LKNARYWYFLWYFADSSGNVTDEVIMQYIELQGEEPEDGNFKVDGDL